ncbi:cytochrome P450 [Streptomyces sp. NPDC003011]
MSTRPPTAPSPGFRTDDPYPAYREARSRCPVVHDPELNAYVVTRYADVAEVLADPASYSSLLAVPMYADNPPAVREALGADVLEDPGTYMVVADPPDHRPLKSLGSALISRERVQRLKPSISARAQRLVDAFEADGRADLVSAFADPLAYGTLCDLLGLPEETRARTRRRIDLALHLIDPSAPEETKLQAAAAVRQWYTEIRKLVAAKADHPGDDLLSDLVLTGHASQAWAYVQSLLGAGIYTTRHLIAGIVHTVLQPEHRSHWDKLAANPAHAPNLVEEHLRRDAPHRGLSRLTTRAVQLGGATIPAGSRVLPLVGSANRDEAVFPDPDTFVPGRSNIRKHLALGRGIHVCVGAHLARTEADVALGILSSRLPNAQLERGFTPSYVPSPYFRGLLELPITW